MISLSGGGYRAALYHAGILRALHEANLFYNYGKPIICAVSGGSFPAALWDLFLRAKEEFQNENKLWPEIQLLELIEKTPKLFGRWNWAVKGCCFFAKRSWYKYLSDWWWNVESSIDQFLKRSHSINHLTLLELLDINTGNILVYYNKNIFEPNNEFFKIFDIYQKFYNPNFNEMFIDPPEAIAIATAFPLYFRSSKISNYKLVDAGLVDNQGILGFLPLFDKTISPFISKNDNWVFSNAAGAINITERYHFLSRWSQTKIVGRLKLSDRIFRFTGNLAQDHYLDLFMKIFSSQLGIKVIGFQIGSLPKEEPWLKTHKYNDAKKIAYMPTALKGICKKDALSVMIQGAQIASYEFISDNQKREKLKRELLSLLG